MRLTPETTGLLVIDWQERLAAVMDAQLHPRHLENALRLARGAAIFRLPVVATEQYPQGLGHTVAALAEALTVDAVAAPVVEKKDFSAWEVAGVRTQMAAAGRRAWLVAGMEAHVCVYQTVRDLVASGHEVWVVKDAVVSRTHENWEVGVGLCQEAGARITSTE